MTTPRKNPLEYLKTGRKRKFETPEDLETLAIGYFEEANELGNPYLIESLCRYCNICRDTLDDYEKRPEFSDMIKRLKTIVLEDAMVGGMKRDWEARITSLVMMRLGKYSNNSINDNNNNNNTKLTLEEEYDNLTNAQLAERIAALEANEESPSA